MPHWVKLHFKHGNNRVPLIWGVWGGNPEPLNLGKKEIWMEKLDAEKYEKIKDSKKQEDVKPQDNIFDTEEIRIEELAVDGICGVYWGI